MNKEFKQKLEVILSDLPEDYFKSKGFESVSIISSEGLKPRLVAKPFGKPEFNVDSEDEILEFFQKISHI